MIQTKRLFVLNLALFVCVSIHATSFPQPVKIDSGAVTGIPGHFDSVAAFLGIPYAAAPVGDLRWKPPVPPAKWSGLLKADHISARCQQVPGKSTAMVGRQRTQTNGVRPTFDVSEDCLYLNVWTPAKSPADKLPVMVWIYGGGFSEGGTTAYDGDGLAPKGVVVVSINYRLGILGFLALPELDRESEHGVSGNYGTLDQIEALKWVHRNIAAFGGDPSRVTIFGQSAGGGSVQFLTLSPLAKGLFQRGISESAMAYARDPYLQGANPEAYRRLRDAEVANQAYLRKAGVDVDVKDLRSMSAAEIEALPAPPYPPAFFSPNVDGWVLPAGYAETYVKGAQNDVSFLGGGTADEDGAIHNLKTTVAGYQDWAHQKFGGIAEAFLKLYPAMTDEDAADAENAAMRDYARTSRFLWAQSRQKDGPNRTFLYYWNRSLPGPRKDDGAFHSSEIPYVQNNYWARNLPFTDEDRAVADMMSSYWVNFAATGDPNGKGLPVWPAFNPNSKVEMQLGVDSGVIPVAPDVKFSFFKRYFESRPTD